MIKMKKLLLTAGVMSALSAQAAFGAGWEQDNVGWYYMFDSGNYASSGWRNIDGKTYYFTPAGYMATGWHYIGYEWIYFAGDGSKANGWVSDNGKWYYCREGVMITGWLDDGGNTYYFHEDGTMAVGEFDTENACYTAQENGAIKKTGSFERNGVKYRYHSDGRVERYNKQKKSWEFMPGRESSVDIIKNQLEEDYAAGYIFFSDKEFERDAKKKLKNYLSEAQIEEFVRDIIITYGRDEDYD